MDITNSSKSRLDPLLLVRQWVDDARTKEPYDAEAMSLATSDKDGKVSLRMVLLRGMDERGLVFYTNLNSKKAYDIQENPWVALCFHWKSTARQIRVEGTANLVTDAEADSYFRSRDRESRIGAWTSRQSEILPNREVLERRFREFHKKYEGDDVPRPEFWSGYRVSAERIEFWEKMPHRLHERKLFEKDGDSWTDVLLYP